MKVFLWISSWSWGLIQSTSENGTFGLGNWTHLCKVIKHVQHGPKCLKLEQDRFGTGFVFDKPNDFVRISDSAPSCLGTKPVLSEIRTFGFQTFTVYIFFLYLKRSKLVRSVAVLGILSFTVCKVNVCNSDVWNPNLFEMRTCQKSKMLCFPFSDKWGVCHPD